MSQEQIADVLLGSIGATNTSKNARTLHDTIVQEVARARKQYIASSYNQSTEPATNVYEMPTRRATEVRPHLPTAAAAHQASFADPLARINPMGASSGGALARMIGSATGSNRQWWKGKLCMTVARAVACSILVAIVLIIVKPEAVVCIRSKRATHNGDLRQKRSTKQKTRRVNYGSVCILSVLTGILATCMFGG